MTDSGTQGTAQQIVTICCGGENTLKSLLDPWAPDCGELIYLPYSFWAIQHSGRWVLVDCGPHPGLATDPALRLGADAQMADIRVAPDDEVVNRLTVCGIATSTVTDVILTHLHYDHCGGLESLPNATVHVQEAELAFANDPPVYQQGAYVPADWAPVKKWAVHAGERDAFGDGAIVLIPTPGHTPGHQSVLVRLENETVICVGDAAYHPAKMAERKLPGYLWNPDAIISSWERLERIQAATEATLLFSHYPRVGTRSAAVPSKPLRAPRR